jgi:hypothetical protein
MWHGESRRPRMPWRSILVLLVLLLPTHWASFHPLGTWPKWRFLSAAVYLLQSCTEKELRKRELMRKPGRKSRLAWGCLLYGHHCSWPYSLPRHGGLHKPILLFPYFHLVLCVKPQRRLLSGSTASLPLFSPNVL